MSGKNKGGFGLVGLMMGAVAGAAAMLFVDEKKRKQMQAKVTKVVKEGKKKADDSKIVEKSVKAAKEWWEKIKKVG